MGSVVLEKTESGPQSLDQWGTKGMRPVTAPTIELKACTTGLGLDCLAGAGCCDGAACASAGDCVALSVFAPFSGFTGAPSRSGSLAVSVGAQWPAASALATTTWAADLLESLVGNSSFGVDRSATPAASIAAFGAGLTGGNGASLVCAATPEFVAEGVGAAICVWSGESGTVGTGTGLESRDCRRRRRRGGDRRRCGRRVDQLRERLSRGRIGRRLRRGGCCRPQVRRRRRIIERDASVQIDWPLLRD